MNYKDTAGYRLMQHEQYLKKMIKKGKKNNTIGKDNNDSSEYDNFTKKVNNTSISENGQAF